MYNKKQSTHHVSKNEVNPSKESRIIKKHNTHITLKRSYVIQTEDEPKNRIISIIFYQKCPIRCLFHYHRICNLLAQNPSSLYSRTIINKQKKSRKIELSESSSTTFGHKTARIQIKSPICCSFLYHQA